MNRPIFNEHSNLFGHATTLAIFIFMVCLANSCTNGTKDPNQNGNDTPAVEIPTFNADNAFQFIEDQLAFGPRVPNSEAHAACADWFVEKFEEFGAEVKVQEAEAKAYNGDVLNMKNIIASYNPEKKRRVLLCAHWDSRHISDWDPDEEDREKPVPAADDGGSGVAALLEIARILGEKGMDYMGVDIILFDAEDYGQPRDGGGFPVQEDTWCLGSQYWSKNPHKPGYKANYGILLDMVGARSPRFPKEGTSMKHAADIVEKVWKEAARSGYSSYFSKDRTPEIIDDHKYINEIIGIPTIDIINKPKGSPSGFGPHWHTSDDNIEIIDKNTLKAVGQTVLNVIYKESVMAI